MRNRVFTAVFAAVLFASSTASAGVIDPSDNSPAMAASGTWLAWGGETRFHFNPDELQRLGIHVDRRVGASSYVAGKPGVTYEIDAFPALDSSGLEVNHVGQVISGLGGGALHHAGGLILGYPGGSVDLRGFSLRPGADARLGLEVVDAAGTVWFTADHAHYGFEENAPDVFSMRQMNLRLSPHFAAVLGVAPRSGTSIGGLDFRAKSYAGQKNMSVAATCSAPWASPTAPADLAMIYDSTASGDTHPDDVYIKRCNICTGSTCTDPCTTTSTTGSVVITQDSTLKNVGTTAIPWYEKFNPDTNGTPQPPYDNDQHPFLIWNLYRVSADGRIKQIGASGIKHAFYTVNYNCGCDGGHTLWPQCEDTYSSYNNDGSTYLGPRSEVIPASGQWGRCDSVYDANCDGVKDPAGGAADLHQYRMNVIESDLLPPQSSGARYFIEYWYIVRDDPTIYSGMAYREVTFAKTTRPEALWTIDLVGDTPLGADFHLGPLLNLWVDPVAKPAYNVEVSTPLGRARIALKVTALGGGQWRYQYAVANYDYAHSHIDPAHATEPNVKVDFDAGFSRFSVPAPAGIAIANLAFADTDLDAGNDWTAVNANNQLTWTAPAGHTLDWGTMYRFEFTANAPPAASSGSAQLVGVANPFEAEQPYTAAVPIPGGTSSDLIFADGFDPL